MYAKVFTQIFDSSIADDYELRHFFMDMLVLADSDGIVDMTHSAIAAKTRIPTEKVSALLDRLELPDNESRTADADGRRIQRLDAHRSWGWLIINYDRFRALGNDLERKEQVRARVAKYRAKVRKLNDVTHGNADVTAPSASASVSASVFVQGKGCGERDFPEVEIPSWPEVQTEASKIGLVDWKAKDWFDDMQASGWKDRHNRHVQNWRALLSRVRTWWEADGRPMTPKKARRDRNGQTEASKQTENHTGNF